MDSLSRSFNDMFSSAGFVAPGRIFERRRSWRMWSGSSRLEFVFGENARDEYLEYSALSKFAGEARGRIYEDGSTERLEPEQEFVIFDSEKPGSLEAADAAMLQHNKRVEQQKQAAGFSEEPDHSLLRDALPRAADYLDAEWQHMIDGPRRESRFEKALRRAMEFDIGPLVELGKRVNLGENWPNQPPRRLGGVDLLVRYMPQTIPVEAGTETQWRYLAELKWSAKCQEKICEALWDALKMLAGSQVPYVEAAYLVTAASKADWTKTPACAELFSDGEWDVRELLTKYPKQWKSLVKNSGPPPLRLPNRFRTTAVATQQIRNFVVKAVAVSTDCWAAEDHLRFDEGFLGPA